MEEIAKLAFPNEEIDMNDFNDWAKENSDEAYKLALQIIADLKHKRSVDKSMSVFNAENHERTCADAQLLVNELQIEIEDLEATKKDDAVKFYEWMKEVAVTNENKGFDSLGNKVLIDAKVMNVDEAYSLFKKDQKNNSNL